MDEKVLGEAIVEFKSILDHCPIEVQSKIPNRFMDELNNLESKTYKFNYDESKKIEEQNIKPGTKGLIGLVYRDYICDNKEDYINKYKIYFNNKEIEKREKYNTDTIFKNRIDSRREYSYDKKLPTKKEKIGFFRKLINIIKSIIKGQNNYCI